MKSAPQLEAWKSNPMYQAFLRQVHADIFVGLKNGAPEQELKDTLNALADDVRDSVDWEVSAGVDFYDENNS